MKISLFGTFNTNYFFIVTNNNINNNNNKLVKMWNEMLHLQNRTTLQATYLPLRVVSTN